MTPRLFRVLLFLGACAVLLSSSAKAENTAGINITVYNNFGYNNAPPYPGDNRIVGTMVGSRIENNFDSEPLFNMYEDFAVKYEGFITAPCTCPVEFMAQADDGTKLYLDGELITEDWYDKGGGGSVSQPVQFQDGVSKEITLWFYENGGGARVLRMADRGRIADGLRADLVVVDPDTREVVATIAGGRLSHLSGRVAARFMDVRGAARMAAE